MDWQNVEELAITYSGGYSPVPQAIQEWCYQAIYPKWLAWPDQRGFAPGGSTLKKIIYPDAGSVEWQTAGTIAGDAAYLPDFLAGIPLQPLDPWRDPANSLSDVYYTWI